MMRTGTISPKMSRARRGAARVSTALLEQLEPRLLLASGGTFWEIWSPPDPTPGVDVGRFSSLKLDANGDPHISYYDQANGNLKYVSGDATTRTWGTPVVVDSAGNVGRFSSLALDSNENPHIAYYDATTTSLKYASFSGAAWTTDTVDTGSVGEFCSLALDSMDIPHFSYYDGFLRGLKYATVGLLNPWDTYVLDRGGTAVAPGWVGTYTSIALDSADTPHISYYDVIDGAVKYAELRGNFWYTSFADGATATPLWETEWTQTNDQTVPVNDWQNPTRVVPITWERIGTQLDIKSTTLTVRLSDAANGTVVADAMRIVGPSGDIIVDDGQAGGFTQTGAWTSVVGVTGAYPSVAPNFGGNYRTHAGGGTGQNWVEWTFSGIATGKYDIFSTWLGAPGLATDATYEIYDGTGLPTTDQDQTKAPVDWADPAAVAPTHWEQLATNVNIGSGTLKVQLGTTATGQVMADAIRVVNHATGVVYAYLNNGQAGFTSAGSWVAASGAGGYNNDYMTHPVGAGPDLAVWSFVGVPVANYDIYATWLSNATYATDAPFEIFDNAASKGTALVNQTVDPNDVDDPAQVVGLTWNLIGANVSAGQGFIRVTLTDQTNQPKNVIADAIRIVKQGAAPAVDQIIDNNMAGYVDNGTWTPVSGSGGYSDDYETHVGGGQGLNTASWTFNGLAVGTVYNVYATWAAAAGNVTDAPYTISNQRLVGTAQKDQTFDPNDWVNPTQVDPFWWELIGPPVHIDYGSLSVDVFDSPDGNVQADAIRIVGVGGTVYDATIDNDSGTFQTLGRSLWTYVTGLGGMADDYREIGPGVGYNACDYYFTAPGGLPVGWYRVYASWVPNPANSWDALYTVTDGIRGNMQITAITDEVGEFSSVALDASGKPFVIYHALRTAGGGTLQDLRLATLVQSGNPTQWKWGVSTLDSTGDVGEFGSLVLDGANRPHATYLDYTNGDLKYAYWDGSAWVSELVDDLGWDAPAGPSKGKNVGFTTSLQLGDNGMGYVSYFNYSNHTLAFASQNAKPTLTTISNFGMVAPFAYQNTAYQITYSMLANAANESDAEGDPISFRVESVTTGTLTQGGVPVIPGATVLTSGGPSLFWTPAVGATGLLNTFTVVAWESPQVGAATTDDRAISAAPVQVKVNVLSTPVNGPPTLTLINTLPGAGMNNPVTITYAALLAASNLADPDPADVLSFRIEGVTTGTLTKGGVGVVPGVTMLGLGEQVVWTPAAGATGVQPAFTVVGWDGYQASVGAVQVNVQLAAPVLPDLVAAIKTKLPRTVWPGVHTRANGTTWTGKTPRIQFTVTNQGGAAAIGSLAVDVYVSTSSTFSTATATKLSSDLLTINLSSAAARKNSRKFTLAGVDAPSLAAGNYFFYVLLNPTGAFTESSLVNNAAGTAQTTQWL